jgi:tetratricopeptide (TPR) repeat protein
MNRKTITVKTAAFAFLLAVCASAVYAEGLADRNAGANKDGTPQTAEAFFERGDEFMENYNFELAIADFTEAIKLAPDNAVFYMKRGHAYFSIKDFDRAINDYNTALRIYPNLVSALYGRGYAYAYKGEWELARADMENHHKIFIRVNFIHDIFGRGAYDRRGEYDKIIADYSAMLNIQPDDINVLNSRGEAYIFKGEYDKAIADLNIALGMKPDFVNALITRSAMYFLKDEYDPAITDLNAVLNIEPDNIYALSGRGIVYFYVGREYDKAIVDFETVQKFKLTPDYANVIGNLIENVKRRKRERELGWID